MPKKLTVYLNGDDHYEATLPDGLILEVFAGPPPASAKQKAGHRLRTVAEARKSRTSARQPSRDQSGEHEDWDLPATFILKREVKTRVTDEGTDAGVYGVRDEGKDPGNWGYRK